MAGGAAATGLSIPLSSCGLRSSAAGKTSDRPGPGRHGSEDDPGDDRHGSRTEFRQAPEDGLLLPTRHHDAGFEPGCVVLIYHRNEPGGPRYG